MASLNHSPARNKNPTTPCTDSFPITSSVQLHSLGESTITKEASIFSTNDETLFAAAKVKHALVDMTTRKSVTLPKESRDKYAASGKPSSSFSRFVVPDPTAAAYHCEFLMIYSDTDALPASSLHKPLPRLRDDFR